MILHHYIKSEFSLTPTQLISDSLRVVEVFVSCVPSVCSKAIMQAILISQLISIYICQRIPHPLLTGNLHSYFSTHAKVVQILSLPVKHYSILASNRSMNTGLVFVKNVHTQRTGSNIFDGVSWRQCLNHIDKINFKANLLTYHFV